MSIVSLLVIEDKTSPGDIRALLLMTCNIIFISQPMHQYYGNIIRTQLEYTYLRFKIKAADSSYLSKQL